MQNAGGQDGAITHYLREIREGHDASHAEAQVVRLAYEEMRHIAGSVAGNNHAATINATALVHEAWLKINGKLTDVSDRTHFLALASRAMRQVMADAARAKKSLKRGGDGVRYTLHDADGAVNPQQIDLADIHEMLETLRQPHERQAEVFELRAFGMLTFEEIGKLLEISESSARLDWQFARAFIRSRFDQLSDETARDVPQS